PPRNAAVAVGSVPTDQDSTSTPPAVACTGDPHRQSQRRRPGALSRHVTADHARGSFPFEQRINSPPINNSARTATANGAAWVPVTARTPPRSVARSPAPPSEPAVLSGPVSPSTPTSPSGPAPDPESASVPSWPAESSPAPIPTEGPSPDRPPYEGPSPGTASSPSSPAPSSPAPPSPGVTAGKTSSSVGSGLALIRALVSEGAASVSSNRPFISMEPSSAISGRMVSWSVETNQSSLTSVGRSASSCIAASARAPTEDRPLK